MFNLCKLHLADLLSEPHARTHACSKQHALVNHDSLVHVLIISQNISVGYVAECVGYLCRQRGAVCGMRRGEEQRNASLHLCVYVGEERGSDLYLRSVSAALARPMG